MSTTAIPMGIGKIGSPDTNFKRKFRFTFQITGFCNNARNTIPENFVRIASRPKLSIEETEFMYLNAVSWEPGRARWETINVTYIDVANDTNRLLQGWLATIYNYADPINLTMGRRRDWDSTGIINMYDGCGTLLEQWQLQHMFPTDVDWGSLEYDSNEFAEIELTLRYSDVIYKSYCPDFTPQGCCTPCGSNIIGTV